MTKIRVMREMRWTEQELNNQDPHTVRLLIMDMNAEQEAAAQIHREAKRKSDWKSWFRR